MCHDTWDYFKEFVKRRWTLCLTCKLQNIYAKAEILTYYHEKTSEYRNITHVQNMFHVKNSDQVYSRVYSLGERGTHSVTVSIIIVYKQIIQ